MSNRKRANGKHEMDKVDIARLHLEGYSVKEIAVWINEHREYSLALGTIYSDLREIRAEWQESYLRDFDAAKAKELARLDKLEREYWEAWERSQSDKEMSESESTTDEHENKAGATVQSYSRRKAKRKTEARDGDDKFLAGVERCITLRAKLLGLDEPKTVNINWRDRAREEGIDPDKFKENLVDQFVEAAQKGVKKEENSKVEKIVEKAAEKQDKVDEKDSIG